MNQQPKNDESALAQSPKSVDPNKRWRIHRRTIAVVFCVVLLPWILIAIPGTVISSAGSSYSGSSHVVYGWPFVHLESARYSASGDWVNGKFVLGRRPKDSDLALEAAKSAAGYSEGRSWVEPNLRLGRRDFAVGWLGEIGYWSELANWPAPEAGTHFTPRYIGLVLNLIAVVLLAGVVVGLCEYRIRHRHRLLRYSLASLLIVMALFGIAITRILRTHQEIALQSGLNDALEAVCGQPNSPVNSFYVDYSDRFPLIVSQLFNHGKHPWGTIPMFRKIKSGNIVIYLNVDVDSQKLASINELAIATQYALHLSVANFSPQRQRMLETLGGGNIETLDLNLDSYVWLNEKFGNEQFDGQWEDFRKQAGFKVNLDFDMSRLKEVRLYLDGTMSQKEQLKPFVGLPALRSASISQLSTEGAEFVWETRTKWPKSMEFPVFSDSFFDESCDELQEKLESEFEWDPELAGRW